MEIWPGMSWTGSSSEASLGGGPIVAVVEPVLSHNWIERR
jgi:hypothetical protein